MKHLFYYSVLVICLSLASCGDKKESEQKVLRVKVQTVDSLANFSSFTYVGSVEEGSSVPMSFVGGGTIKTLNVTNGDIVRKGDKLLTVDNTSVKSLLKTAEAKLRQAEDGYARVKQVYDAGGISEVKFVEVRTQLEEARATVTGLRKQVSNCVLTAPMDGVVCNCDVEVGQNLLPNQTAMVIVNMKNQKVTISVAENKIGKMKVGDRGVVSFPAIDGLRIPCAVEKKGVLAKSITHTYEVTMSLLPDSTVDESELAMLLPGMVAKVNMLYQTHEGFVLPAYCVQNGYNQLTVWVVNNGEATRREIVVGSFVGDHVLVTDGIKQGDMVVVGGFQKLYNGAKVKPTK
ncbi:MAG: efflux RND transporter periplasmic adaptor subunit [bacterium]|nr:efflux RND transporter periplasmic adaptor subunit [Candidatus Minthenecus merdequi]